MNLSLVTSLQADEGRASYEQRVTQTLATKDDCLTHATMAFTGSNAPNGLGNSPLSNSSKAWYQAGNDSFTSRTSLRQEAQAPAQKGRQRGGVHWPSWVILSTSRVILHLKTCVYQTSHLARAYPEGTALSDTSGSFSQGYLHCSYIRTQGCTAMVACNLAVQDLHSPCLRDQLGRHAHR